MLRKKLNCLNLMAKHKNKGFTLIELLVVIAIIGLLASIVLVSLNSARKKGRDAKRAAELKQIQTALEMYYDNYNAYPVGSAGSDRGCWINNEGYSSCHPLGALKDSGLMARVPYDPGTNTYTATSPCEGAQFYSYWSDNGQRYMLGTVQESKTGSCLCNFGWGQYQICLWGGSW